MEHKIVPVPSNKELGMCKICTAAEGEMPTECPGREMSSVEKDAVFGGWADYENGRWYSKVPTKHRDKIADLIDEARKISQELHSVLDQ